MANATIPYNPIMVMTYNYRINKRWIDWIVLFSLVLGQLMMSAGVVAAQSPGKTQVPVCTSTGVVYVSWPNGLINNSASQATASTAETTQAATHAGSCIWCTVSPTQLRFDLQSALLPAPIWVATANHIVTEPLTIRGSDGHPYATPRAPPLV